MLRLDSDIWGSRDGKKIASSQIIMALKILVMPKQLLVNPLHSERPKLYLNLAFLSVHVIGLKDIWV